MKKLIFSLILALTPFLANAASHVDQSFLNVTSLQVSNVAAISNHVMFPLMTNIIGTTWTNLQGTLVTVTNAGSTTTLVKDCSLWFDSLGRIPLQEIHTPDIAGGTNFTYVSGATVYIKLYGGAGANSSVTFKFTPIFKHTKVAGETPYVATTLDHTVTVTAAAGVVTQVSNLPLHLWPGASGVRVRSIVNSDTDYTGNVWIQELALVGFVP